MLRLVGYTMLVMGFLACALALVCVAYWWNIPTFALACALGIGFIMTGFLLLERADYEAWLRSRSRF